MIFGKEEVKWGGKKKMEINCDECGKEYRIDLNKMTVKTGKFKCKACNNILVVTQPEPLEEPELIDFVEEI